ncbi:MAG: TolC family protein [Muribaculaceae bacterium]|nr:TolC family protein [Muribaculaceae bacterium]
MKKVLMILAAVLLCIACLRAQASDTLRLTLDRAVDMARLRSVEAAAALDELRSAYWQYRTYRAELLPEITFKGTLPSYGKRYSSYQQSDGSYTFVRNDNLSLSGELSLSQRIWLTGGTVSLSTSLDYMRQLSGAKGNSFMSVPVALTLNQPLFAANDIKWKRRIEPVRYREARARFITDTEQVAMDAVQYFFNVLIAADDLASARQNLANAEKLYDVAVAKHRMGQISRNDLLQIELTLLNARSAVSAGESTVKSHRFQLISFLGIDSGTELVLVDPERLPDMYVDYAEALDLALANNPFADNLRRRQLEADYEVAKAKGAMREVSVFAQVGYTGTDRQFGDAYSRLKDNQIVEVGVSLPLLDWGKRRAAVKVAESRRELVANTLRKEALDFNSNLFVLVERFNNQREQLRIADRAAEIAQQRYTTNVETFMVGRISTLDLNDSQQSKDSARRSQLSELFAYWHYFYQLRSITLYDFGRRAPVDVEDLVF